MKAETTTRSEFPNGGETIVEQVLASEDRNNSKKSTVRVIGIQVAKLAI